MGEVVKLSPVNLSAVKPGQAHKTPALPARKQVVEQKSAVPSVSAPAPATLPAPKPQKSDNKEARVIFRSVLIPFSWKCCLF